MLFGEDFLQFPEYISNINEYFQIPLKASEKERMIFDFLWGVNGRWFMCPVMPRGLDHVVFPNGFCSCTFNYVFNANALTDSGTIYNIDSYTRCTYGRPWILYIRQAKAGGFLNEALEIYSLESMNKILRPTVEVDPFWDSLKSNEIQRNWAAEQKCWRTLAFERNWHDALLYSRVPPGYYNWSAILHKLGGWDEFEKVAKADWSKKETLIISFKRNPVI